MLTPKRFRERAARFFLHREPEPERERRGVNLPQAQSVALLYIDTDEQYFREIRSLVKEMHDLYGVKKVWAMGYIDAPAKAIPNYQAQKLEYMYFTKSDLNWHMKPNASLMNFLSEPFDLLIDLSRQPCYPMRYVVKASKSKMKVGTGMAKASELYDLCVQLNGVSDNKAVWNTLLHYLTKPNLK
ncbi:MAG: hypothetical protein ACFCUH_01270 [Flavobacteriales bacterium]